MKEPLLYICIGASLLWHCFFLLVFPPKATPSYEVEEKVYYIRYESSSTAQQNIENKEKDNVEDEEWSPEIATDLNSGQKGITGVKLVELPERQEADNFILDEIAQETIMSTYMSNDFLDRGDKRSIPEPEFKPEMPIDIAEEKVDKVEIEKSDNLEISIDFSDASKSREILSGPGKMRFPKWVEEKGEEFDAAFRMQFSESGNIEKSEIKTTTGYAELDEYLIKKVGKLQLAPSSEKSEIIIKIRGKLEGLLEDDSEKNEKEEEEDKDNELDKLVNPSLEDIEKKRE